ncbi:MAG: TetR/AcrR family transcriptional regulator [Thermodesulfobacteriota bacterium]
MDRPLSRRESKKRSMRENIFKTAIYLFRTKGFDQTTLEEITESLDVSRATFFNYYASKNQILHELAHRTVRNYKEILEKKIQSDLTTRETLTSIMETVVDSLKGYKDLFRTVFLEIMRSQIGFVEQGDEEKGRWTVNDLMAEIIIRGQERAELKEEDPYLLAEMITGSTFNILLNWLHTKEQYSVKDRLRKSVELLLDGAGVGARRREERLGSEADSTKAMTPTR